MTILSTEVHEEDILRLEGVLFKVVGVNLHTGGGKSGAMVHAKLRNLDTGHVSERRFATTERLEKMDIQRVEVQFLYAEGENLVFMDQASYEQYTLRQTVIGPASRFIKEGTLLDLIMHDGKPISVDFPSVVELKVVSTGAGLRGQGDTTYKEATLENQMTVMVPQFIREGDVIHVNVETGEFMDRIREKTGPEKQVFKAEKPTVKKT
ncbi:MAG: elongation factor P [Elusimicrobia bacterium]|nr:elongation factor P [Elusimicrobiota bacterium]